MNKCNVTKKKIIILTDNKFSQDMFIKTQTSGESSDNECQQVTTNDNEWH